MKKVSRACVPLLKNVKPYNTLIFFGSVHTKPFLSCMPSLYVVEPKKCSHLVHPLLENRLKRNKMKTGKILETNQVGIFIQWICIPYLVQIGWIETEKFGNKEILSPPIPLHHPLSLSRTLRPFSATFKVP